MLNRLCCLSGAYPTRDTHTFGCYISQFCSPGISASLKPCSRPDRPQDLRLRTPITRVLSCSHALYNRFIRYTGQVYSVTLGQVAWVVKGRLQTTPSFRQPLSHRRASFFAYSYEFLQRLLRNPKRKVAGSGFGVPNRRLDASNLTPATRVATFVTWFIIAAIVPG